MGSITVPGQLQPAFVHGRTVNGAADIERVFDGLGNRPDTGLVLPPDVFTTTKANLELIASLAARTRLPTIYPYRYMVAAGGLISYGIDSIDLYRRVPACVDRIHEPDD
jgi:putative tryptophan/tyrosine transport system substrate-binding protein